jgi:SAM-dependent methyltransferase
MMEVDIRPRLQAVMKSVRKGAPADVAGLVEKTLQTILECGHLPNVEHIDSLIDMKGKRILEVGCGHCWYAPFILERGAVSYVGTDPFRDFDEKRIYNYNQLKSNDWKDAYITGDLPLRVFLEAFDNIGLYDEDILDLDFPASSFDGIFLITVSEHFKDPQASFQKIYDLLSPGGRLFISHHNYYSWAGHHQQPKYVSEYDAGNDEMRRVVDWNHVINFLTNDKASTDYLNFIRIHELTGIIKKLFQIDSCQFEESKEETGGCRLTEEIRRKLPEYYREELLTDMVYYVCTKSNG